MKTQSLMRADRRWILYSAGAMLAALILGAGAAWALREPYLLDVPAEVVPRQASAEAQYNYARKLPSEAAWQSVEKYFPSDKKFVPLAKRELAMTYLLEQDDAESRAKAMKLFEWFANRPDVERNDQVFGIAGEAIVDSLDHKPTESVKKLQELEKVAGRLDSEQVQRMLGQRMSASLAGVIRRNQQAIGKETADKWEKLLESLSEDAN